VGFVFVHFFLSNRFVSVVIRYLDKVFIWDTPVSSYWALKFTEQILMFQRSKLYLEDTLKCDSSKVLDKDLFLCHLHMVGEVAIHNPRHVDVKTFQLLQRFLFISDTNSKNKFLHLCIFYPKINIVLNLKKIWRQYLSHSFSSEYDFMADIFMV
jgi:hypothetical protein